MLCLFWGTDDTLPTLIWLRKLHKDHMHHLLNRGSYINAHVLLNLLNGFGKRDKMRGFFVATSLINSIIQENSCEILFII